MNWGMLDVDNNAYSYTTGMWGMEFISIRSIPLYVFWLTAYTYLNKT